MRYDEQDTTPVVANLKETAFKTQPVLAESGHTPVVVHAVANTQCVPAVAQKNESECA